MTDPTSHVNLVRTTLQAADSGDLDGCRAGMHPDLTVTIAGVPTPIVGRENWLGSVAQMAEAFPDLKTTVADVVATGDRVAVRTIITGTHRGAFHGIEATGRPIEVMSNDFYRVENDRIVEGWIVTDTGTLFSQIS
ncbi:hypothetical protein CFN78_21080 [Amycolatopsis antarctica]|uniref:Ester cyclase n=1 Tax=Amycolatopsis antarctica TaxID=1854586 RepID=A0A263CZH8_9PSEU|nr:ester cyclase [Amycolatopsis antarctica]OZM71288.1 hypothetical protein CFN78_21080 [Amycolatopsis antarctica]